MKTAPQKTGEGHGTNHEQANTRPEAARRSNITAPATGASFCSSGGGGRSVLGLRLTQSPTRSPVHMAIPFILTAATLLGGRSRLFLNCRDGCDLRTAWIAMPAMATKSSDPTRRHRALGTMWV